MEYKCMYVCVSVYAVYLSACVCVIIEMCINFMRIYNFIIPGKTKTQKPNMRTKTTEIVSTS